MPFDEDGYPTPETLAEVEHFFDGKRFDDEAVGDYIRYISSLWRSNLIRRCGHILSMSTGGWSSNEALIQAMEKTSFWRICWCQSTRGGHYCIDLSMVPKAKQNGGDAHDN